MGSAAVDTSSPPTWYFPRRFNLVFWTFVAITLAYMMRANLSIAIVDMSNLYKWQSSDQGMFLSAFFWGYITTQMVGGILARKLGAKAVLSFAILVPSLCTLAVPLVASWSPTLFVACRVMTGVAAGPTFPTMYHMMSGWMPFKEKALLLSLVCSGLNVGTIIIEVVGPHIINRWGWQMVFYMSGGCGFVWLLFWVLTISNSPSEMSNIHPSEVKYILQPGVPHERTVMVADKNYSFLNTNAEEAAGEGQVVSEKPVDSWVALKKLMQTSSFWVLVFNALCLNWGAYICLSWLPTYVHSVLGFSLTYSGLIAMTPNISSMISSYASGAICDALLARGYRLKIVRKSFFFLGCVLLISTFLLLAFREELHISSNMAAVILAIGAGMGGLHVSGYSANLYDLAPNHTSVVMGITNTAGTIPGIIGVYSTGFLLDHGASWGTIWLITAGFYGAAMITNLIFADVKRIV